MIKITMSIISLAIIPTLLGLLVTHFMKKEKSKLPMSWLIGFFMEFAITQIFTIPYIFTEKSFSFLFYTCYIIFIALSVISIIINRKNFKEIIADTFNNIKRLKSIWTIMAIILIGINCFVVFNYMHIDEDDSNFVAKATLSLQTDSLYKYIDTGAENNGKLHSRNTLSPFPMYIAMLAKVTGFHPMMIAHTAWPVVATLLIYANYYILAIKIFGDRKDKVSIFLILVNIIYIFGNFSSNSNFSFMLFRLWQGKALLGNLIIPSLINFYFIFAKEENKFINWIILLLIMWSSCLVSTMGFALAPIALFALTLSYVILGFAEIKDSDNKKKTFADVLKLGIFSAFCVIPNIIYSALYLMLKGGEA